MAVKKSRVSKTVKRTALRHSRVLQILKSQAAIPAVYGYGQLDLFEYMAIGLQKDGAGVMVETVIRVVNQTVRKIPIWASSSVEKCN